MIDDDDDDDDDDGEDDGDDDGDDGRTHSGVGWSRMTHKGDDNDEQRWMIVQKQ